MMASDSLSSISYTSASASGESAPFFCWCATPFMLLIAGVVLCIGCMST